LPADAHWQHCGLMSVQEPVDVEPVFDVPVFDVPVFDIPVFDVPVFDVPVLVDDVPVLPVDDDADEPQL
jgi:hypothetical protein